MKILKLYIVSIILLCAWSSCSNDKNNHSDKPNMIITDAMSQDDSLFQKAINKIKFKFPEDFGSHNKFKLEWWYFTGNLKAENGNEYSYQFTIFRNALKYDSIKLNSDFASNQLYFYHFAITDIRNNKFYYYDEYARGATGLAGATYIPLKIFVNNSSITGSFENADSSLPTFHINAIADTYQINLTLKPLKKIILQGDEGLSKKSYDKDNNSYYYSISRLNTEGSIVLDNGGNKQKLKVIGNSWLDREWSTSALSKDQVGWDWFSIQLSDTTEIMYFKLRNKDGKTNFAKGTLIYSNGDKKNLYQPDVFLEEKEYWDNGAGKRYPSKWIMTIPNEQIKLLIETRVKDQELKLNLRYYEGSIKIKGIKGSKEINGLGYVELIY